jgi:hypothetical protein
MPATVRLVPMAVSKAKRAKPGLDPAVIERDLDTLRERLKADGALQLSKIRPPALKAAAIARLPAEGYELGKSWLRRRIAEQVREALAHGALLTKAALTGSVRGASGPELQRALVELEAGGEVRRVLRGGRESFAGGDAEVLGPAAQRALLEPVLELATLLKSAARKTGATLLASDVDGLIGRAAALVGPARKGTLPSRAAAGENGLSRVLAAIDATREERTGLSFVPRLVQRLIPHMPAAVAHQVLLTAARDELIELRPEGGLARLTKEELQLCPSGPGDTRLSWARRLTSSVS